MTKKSKDRILINIPECIIVSILLLGLTTASMVTLKAQEIVKYMNTSVNPCEDFYEFVCGNYLTHNLEKASISEKLSILQTITSKAGDILIEDLATDETTDTSADKKVKTFYRSCVITVVNQKYANEVKQLVGEFGQMPVLNEKEWQEEVFDWSKTLATLIHHTGLDIIFKIDAMPDAENNTIARISIDEPSLVLGNKEAYYQDVGENVRTYVTNNIAENLIAYFGVNLNLALKTAREIFEFERSLALGVKDYNETEYKKFMTLLSSKELDEQFLPLWNVSEFVEGIMESKVSHVLIKHKYVINALEVIQRTPKKIVANYIFYKYLVYFMLPSTNYASKILNNCKDMTWRYFFKNLHNILYRKYPITKAEEVASTMFADFKRILGNMAVVSQNEQWLLEDTLKNFQLKLDHMQFFINTYEDVNFESDLKDFNPDNQNYIGNLRSVLTLLGNRLRDKLNKSAIYDAGTMAANTPLYNPMDNSVHMATTFLQSTVIYSASYPNAYNYASLGFDLAHELAHGFDDVAMHYDFQGNGLDWWDSISLIEFKKRINCLVQQYHNYVFQGHHLPERDIQSENMADNVGLHVAFTAYEEWYNTASFEEQQMEQFPGLSYSDKQLFFISFGHSMCSSWNPKVIDFLLLTDYHTPEKFRVNGALSNTKYFSKAFNCPSGSAMNPDKKCEIY